jgi:hypothetical protein
MLDKIKHSCYAFLLFILKLKQAFNISGSFKLNIEKENLGIMLYWFPTKTITEEKPMFRWINGEAKQNEENEKKLASERALDEAEKHAAFPPEIPELGSKIRLIYADTDENNKPFVRILEGFVVNRFFWLAVKDNGEISDARLIILKISSLEWHGRIGDQDFREVEYNVSRKSWTIAGAWHNENVKARLIKL